MSAVGLSNISFAQYVVTYVLSEHFSLFVLATLGSINVSRPLSQLMNVLPSQVC